jgi:transposase
MQRVEAREGRPLDELLQDLYVGQGMQLSEIAARWGLTVSAISYWLKWADIEARRGGPRREAVA